MDNTELHYVTYDPDAIWQEMVSVYMDNGGEAIKPGEEVDTIFHAVLAMIVRMFAGVDNAMRMGTLRYAAGEYLDIIGENRLCERHKASGATAGIEIFFTDNASGTLPEGTIFTADGKLLWQTTADVEAAAGGNVNTTIRCIQEGSEGNAILPGTQMQVMSSVTMVQNAVTTSGGVDGRDREDDDTYRERIRKYGDLFEIVGTKDQYEGFAMRIPGVKDANAWATLASASGTANVGLSVLVEDGFDPASVIARVQQELENNVGVPLTDTVEAVPSPAQYFSLNAKIEMAYSATASDRENVRKAIDEYILWQNGKVGRPFTPGRLSGMLYGAGAYNVTLSTNEMVNIGNVNHCNVSVTYEIG